MIQIYPPQADKKSVFIRQVRVISRFSGTGCVLYYFYLRSKAVQKSFLYI